MRVPGGCGPQPLSGAAESQSRSPSGRAPGWKEPPAGEAPGPACFLGIVSKGRPTSAARRQSSPMGGYFWPWAAGGRSCCPAKAWPGPWGSASLDTAAGDYGSCLPEQLGAPPPQLFWRGWMTELEVSPGVAGEDGKEGLGESGRRWLRKMGKGVPAGNEGQDPPDPLLRPPLFPRATLTHPAPRRRLPWLHRRAPPRPDFAAPRSLQVQDGGGGRSLTGRAAGGSGRSHWLVPLSGSGPRRRRCGRRRSPKVGEK